MKNLIDIAEEILLESNLSRILSHTQGRNIGMISAHRAEYPAEENEQRYHELKAAVKEHGFGYVPVNGKYVENYGTKDANPVSEKTMFVIGKQGEDHGKLRQFLTQHGEKYGQDSVLFKPHFNEEAYLIGTNHADFPGHQNEVSLGTFHPDRTGEFYSTLRNGRNFKFESVEADPQKTFLNRS